MTDYLFAIPSFLGGIARVLDLGGTLNVINESVTPEEADAKALRSDFMAVGRDLQTVIGDTTETRGDA